MSLVEKPETNESDAPSRNARQFLCVLRDGKSVHAETTEKLRALSVGGFEPQRTRREMAIQARYGEESNPGWEAEALARRA